MFSGFIYTIKPSNFSSPCCFDRPAVGSRGVSDTLNLPSFSHLMNNSSQVADKFIFPEDLKQQRIAHKQLNNSISHLLKSQKHKKPNLNYLNILLRFKECCDSRYQAEIHFWTEEYEKRFLNLPSNPLIERIKKVLIHLNL